MTLSALNSRLPETPFWAMVRLQSRLARHGSRPVTRWWQTLDAPVAARWLSALAFCLFPFWHMRYVDSVGHGTPVSDSETIALAALLLWPTVWSVYARRTVTGGVLVVLVGVFLLTGLQGIALVTWLAGMAGLALSVLVAAAARDMAHGQHIAMLLPMDSRSYRIARIKGRAIVAWEWAIRAFVFILAGQLMAASSETAFPVFDHPWPLFMAVGWGIGLLGACVVGWRDWPRLGCLLGASIPVRPSDVLISLRRHWALLVWTFGSRQPPRMTSPPWAWSGRPGMSRAALLPPAVDWNAWLRRLLAGALRMALWVVPVVILWPEFAFFWAYVMVARGSVAASSQWPAGPLVVPQEPPPSLAAPDDSYSRRGAGGRMIPYWPLLPRSPRALWPRLLFARIVTMLAFWGLATLLVSVSAAFVLPGSEPLPWPLWGYPLVVAVFCILVWPAEPLLRVSYPRHLYLTYWSYLAAASASIVALIAALTRSAPGAPPIPVSALAVGLELVFIAGLMVASWHLCDPNAWPANPRCARSRLLALFAGLSVGVGLVVCGLLSLAIGHMLGQVFG